MRRVVNKLQYDVVAEVGDLKFSLELNPLPGLCSAAVVSGLYVNDPWEAEAYFEKNSVEEVLSELASRVYDIAGVSYNLLIMSDAVDGWDAANGMDEYMDEFNIWKRVRTVLPTSYHMEHTRVKL